jgi:hypothetical protein
VADRGQCRLVARFNLSWLDLAESELGVLTSQCLDRRIPDKQTLIEEIAAWEHDRNANHIKADWGNSPPKTFVCILIPTVLRL